MQTYVTDWLNFQIRLITEYYYNLINNNLMSDCFEYFSVPLIPCDRYHSLESVLKIGTKYIDSSAEIRHNFSKANYGE